jgi:DNA end-binding protein Ku
MARRKEPKVKKAPAAEAGPRGMWSGTLSFGLVSVPVALFPALRRRPVQLRMLAEDGIPLKREYLCSADNKTLGPDDIVRGYEYADGKYVIVEDRELEALEAEKSNDINLLQFARVQDIDSFYFDRPYYLAPSGGSSKAYRLLARVMEEEGKAGIATFVMREREYLVAIIAAQGLLMAETLRFADEVRQPEDIGVTTRPGENPLLSKALKKLVSSLTKPTVDAREMEDRFARRLMHLVERKKKNRNAVVRFAEEEEQGKIIDLVAVFKERMAKASRRRAA